MKNTLGSDKAAPAYRVALKRIIRSGLGWADNKAGTDHLEEQVKFLAKAAPDLVAKGIAHWFIRGAKAWESGNNSGDNRYLEKMLGQCDLFRARAERVLALWGIEVDYPGLYPAFKWRGHWYHDTTSLMRWIKIEEGKNEQ